MKKVLVTLVVSCLVFGAVPFVIAHPQTVSISHAGSQSSGERIHVVQPGETLFSIARAYGVDMWTLARANGIVNPNHILVGQELTIPGEAPPSEVTHTVQPGETLFRISLEYGVPWTTIATTNDINPPYVIYPGQVLTIPGG